MLFAALLWGVAVSASARESTYVYPPASHTMGFNRIGEWQLKLFLGLSAGFDNPQGLAAVKLKSQDDPEDEKDDVWLTLFGVNSGKGQIVYNPSRFEAAEFGKKGSGRERFLDPLGIAANEDGDVAVADAGNRRVVFLHMGERKLEWVAVVDRVDGDILPTDLAWGGGRFWATDAAGGRILSFGPQGESPKVWPIRGDPLESPRGLALHSPGDAWTRVGRFQLLVVDEDGQRLRRYDRDGELREERRLEDLIEPPGKFIYPAADLYGNFILADSVAGRLVKLDRRLRPLAVMRRIDEDPRPLQHPRGLALWRRYGQLFIAEEDGGAYLWTGTDIFDPALSWKKMRDGKSALMLSLRLSESSLVTLSAKIGEEEVELIGERRHSEGLMKQWLQNDDRIARATEIIVRARPTYSAKKTLRVQRNLPIPEPRP